MEEEIELINSLQNYLMEVADGTDQTFLEIQNFQNLLEKLNLSIVVENILVAVRYCSIKLPQIAQNVKIIMEKYQNPNEKQKFLKELKMQTFHIICHCSYETKSTYAAFVYQLAKQNVLQLDDVINKITKMWKTHEEHQDSIWVLFMWFSVEMSEIFPALLKKMNMSQRLRIPPLFFSLFHKFTGLNDNPLFSWQSIRNERDISCQEGSIIQAVMNDDIDALQELSSAPGFNFLNQQNNSLFSYCKFMLYNPNLLQIACLYGSTKCFKFLLLNELKPSMKDKKMHTAAKYAIVGGNIEIIRLIAQKNVSFKGMAHVAAAYHKHDIFNWLINNEDIDSENNKKFPVIFSCIKSNNFIDLFSSIGCETDILGFTVIHQCAKKGRLSMLKYLIENFTFDIIQRDQKEYTPLDYAALHGNYNVFQYLLEMDCNNKENIKKNDEFIFLYAVLCYKCIKLLIKKHYDNYNIQKDQTPLIFAVNINATKTVQALVQFPNIDINHKDNISWSALHHAAKNGNLNISKILLSHPKIQKNIGTSDRKTPLYIALQYAQMPLAQFFLENGMVYQTNDYQ